MRMSFGRLSTAAFARDAHTDTIGSIQSNAPAEMSSALISLSRDSGAGCITSGVCGFGRGAFAWSFDVLGMRLYVGKYSTVSVVLSVGVLAFTKDVFNGSFAWSSVACPKDFAVF